MNIVRYRHDGGVFVGTGDERSVTPLPGIEALGRLWELPLPRRRR